MAIDLDEARNQTPGCARRIHLNNAGSGLMTFRTLHTVLTHLVYEAEIGGHEAQQVVREDIDGVYQAVAELLGASAHEIALVDDATRAWNEACDALAPHEGDRVLISRAKRHGSTLALRRAEERGVKIVTVPDDEHGQLDVAALRNLIDERTRLVAVTHVPSDNGLINPVEEIGRITRAAGVPFLLDATQSAGQLPLDVHRIGCDLLCGAGSRFLRGPRGTGFLWISGALAGRVPGPPHFEAFDRDIAGLLGLGEAVRQALELGVDEISARALGLAQRLRARLAEIDGVTVHDRGLRKSAIVAAAHANIPAEQLAAHLRDHGVNLGVTWPPYPGVDLIGRVEPLLRFSPHHYTTEQEIDETADALAAHLRSHPHRKAARP